MVATWGTITEISVSKLPASCELRQYDSTDDFDFDDEIVENNGSDSD